MNKIIFEFQNISIPNNFENDINLQFHESNEIIKIRPSQSLSGIEGLIIYVTGKVITHYTIKIIDYTIKNIYSKIQIELLDHRETFILPMDRKKLNNYCEK